MRGSRGQGWINAKKLRGRQVKEEREDEKEGGNRERMRKRDRGVEKVREREKVKDEGERMQGV